MPRSEMRNYIFGFFVFYVIEYSDGRQSTLSNRGSTLTTVTMLYAVEASTLSPVRVFNPAEESILSPVMMRYPAEA